MNLSRRDFQALLATSVLGIARAQNTPPKTEKRRVVPGADTPPPANTPTTAPQAGARSGRRVALVLGNNAYTKAPKLSNALNDVNAMGATLAGFGFETTKLADFSLADGQRALDQFIRGIGNGDVAMLYYSGHGVQIGGENYMVPKDFDPLHGEAKVKAECLSISTAQSRIEHSGARMNIIVIDACRDNPFRKDAKVKGLALMDAGLGTCIALAAGPGQTASDNPREGNGLFTKYLLKEMTSRPAPIEQLFKQVKDQVFNASGQQQRPWLLFDTIGDFLFAKGQAGGVPTGGKQAGGITPAVSSESDEYELALEQGRREFEAGQFNVAVQTFERAVRIRPEDPYGYNAIGATRMRMGQASVAIGFFARAIELRADYAAAYFNRAVAYFNAARYQLAAQDFSWAIDQEPFDPRAFDLRGQTYLALRDNDNAMNDFNKALELNPSDATAFLGRGKIWFRTGKNAEALADLTASLEIRPSGEAFAMRAQAFRAAGMSAESQADAREAERLRVQ
jgi:tetratricopeptide (TPR) repeat protein